MAREVMSDILEDNEINKKKMKRLNFGCQFGIREGFDNVDMKIIGNGVWNFDFNKFPYPIENDAYDYIYSNEVLEHMNKPDKVLEELGRICVNGGVIEIIVPYYNNKGAYSNMEHQHYFSDTSFIVFVNERVDDKMKFEIKTIRMFPTSVGKFLPRLIREKLSLFVGGLISLIDVELRVVKS